MLVASVNSASVQTREGKTLGLIQSGITGVGTLAGGAAAAAGNVARVPFRILITIIVLY